MMRRTGPTPLPHDHYRELLVECHSRQRPEIHDDCSDLPAAVFEPVVSPTDVSYLPYVGEASLNVAHFGPKLSISRSSLSNPEAVRESLACSTKLWKPNR